MKNGWSHRIASYSRWWKRSTSWRHIHSPWLFNLLQAMRNPAFERPAIESLRRELNNNSERLPSVDFGAGSTGNISTVRGVARRSLKRPKHARALAALAHHIPAKQTLELGTSLGLTTAYLAGQSHQVVTLEGNPHALAWATNGWEKLGITNIESREGAFEVTLTNLLAESPSFDLIFIDGNHRGPALIQYVESLLPVLSANGVIACDDIHWSNDMEAAWKHLCDQSIWTLQVDFFEWGLLTRNPALKRESLAVRF